MIIYFRAMRVKDEIKQEALFSATVKVVNEIGFAASSVSKIAKAAGLSPATIYIYHKHKEDLLVSTYKDIKQRFSRALLEDFDAGRPIRDILRRVWFNAFDYISRHPDLFQFSEQFAHSPYSEQVRKSEVNRYFDPLFNVLQRGIEQKIIKDVDMDILIAFIYFPMIVLSNARLSENFSITEENIDTAFTLAWDAIKL